MRVFEVITVKPSKEEILLIARAIFNEIMSDFQDDYENMRSAMENSVILCEYGNEVNELELDIGTFLYEKYFNPETKQMRYEQAEKLYYIYRKKYGEDVLKEKYGKPCDDFLF